MKHDAIDGSSRMWVVTLGPDGRLTEDLDPDYLAALDPAQAQEIAEQLLTAAKLEVARTRVW